MNINLVRNYIPHGASVPLQPKRELCQVDQSGEKKSYSENRGYYSGSFTGSKGETTANVWNKMDKFLSWTADRKVATIAVLSFLAAGVLRPMILIGTSSKENMENNKYASAHAMASGIIGLVVSSIAMMPFDQARKNLEKERKTLPGNLLVNNILTNNEISADAKINLIKRDIKNFDKKLIEELGVADKGAIIDKLKEYNKKADIEKLLDTAKDDAQVTDNMKSFLTNATELNSAVIKNLTKEDLEKLIKEKTLTIQPTNDNKLNKAVTIKLEEVSKAFLKKWDTLKDVVKVKNETFHFVDMLPETVAFGPMKAALTIMLIPMILKHVFGMEKNKNKVSKDVPPPNNQVNKEIVPLYPSIEKFLGGAR